MQLVRFIDQGPWRLGASRTDQPHYRFRQTKSGNIGVEEDGWQVGFCRAPHEPCGSQDE
jgi:hypothetical protein